MSWSGTPNLNFEPEAKPFGTPVCDLELEAFLLGTVWADLELSLVPHKDGFILGDILDVVTQLEDSLVLVNMVMFHLKRPICYFD